jgi:hypothetical protein
METINDKDMLDIFAAKVEERALFKNQRNTFINKRIYSRKRNKIISI